MRSLRDAGRLAAAIEVLTEIETRHRPVRLALKDWGEAARYAGAKDRAFVSGLVLDVLRRRRSLAWRMGEDSPRAAALGALRFVWDWPLERIAEAAGEEPHGPGPLTEAERAAPGRARDLAEAPGAGARRLSRLAGRRRLTRAFGERRAEEGAALAERAPVDLRVNTAEDRCRAGAEGARRRSPPSRPDVLPTRAAHRRRPTPPSARRRWRPSRQFAKGWFEVQDLGSQIAAAAAGEVKGKQVLDLCAGGGGKTLALAAAMGNTGQIYAYDTDARRLADTVRRGAAGGRAQPAGPLAGEPRRRWRAWRAGWTWSSSTRPAPARAPGGAIPDAKWRLTPDTARAAHGRAGRGARRRRARFVKPGGRMVYVTCSVLPRRTRTASPPSSRAHRRASTPRRATADAEAHRDTSPPDGFLRLIAAHLRHRRLLRRRAGETPLTEPHVHAYGRLTAPDHERVLIVDFGSQVTQLIARRRARERRLLRDPPLRQGRAPCWTPSRPRR